MFLIHLLNNIIWKKFLNLLKDSKICFKWYLAAEHP